MPNQMALPERFWLEVEERTGMPDAFRPRSPEVCCVKHIERATQAERRRQGGSIRPEQLEETDAVSLSALRSAAWQSGLGRIVPATKLVRFGENVRNLRTERDWTQEQLAEEAPALRLHIRAAIGTLAAWIRASRLPRPGRAETRALGMVHPSQNFCGPRPSKS